MTTLKEEIKELELIQKELEQARADVLRLEKAEHETLQSIKDVKEEELKKYWDEHYKGNSDIEKWFKNNKGGRYENHC